MAVRRKLDTLKEISTYIPIVLYTSWEIVCYSLVNNLVRRPLHWSLYLLATVLLQLLKLLSWHSVYCSKPAGWRQTNIEDSNHSTSLIIQPN